MHGLTKWIQLLVAVLAFVGLWSPLAQAMPTTAPVQVPFATPAGQISVNVFGAPDFYGADLLVRYDRTLLGLAPAPTYTANTSVDPALVTVNSTPTTNLLFSLVFDILAPGPFLTDVLIWGEFNFDPNPVALLQADALKSTITVLGPSVVPSPATHVLVLGALALLALSRRVASDARRSP